VFEQFSISHMSLLIKGAGLTIYLCSLSGLLGLFLGFFVGLGSTANNRIIKGICKVYVKLIRGIPLLVLLFMIYFGIPTLFKGINISRAVASMGGLTIYAGAYIGEIVRGNIQSVHKGQVEAATALGMNYFQKNIFIILPQAIRTMIPSLVGFLIALVKDSSLVSIIGYIDLVKSGKIVANITLDPLKTFLIVALLYFIICFCLSKLANYFEAKFQD